MRAVFGVLSSRSYWVLFCTVLAIATLAVGAVSALQFDEARVRQTAQARYGQRGVTQLERWLNMMSQQRSLPEQQQLRAVNNFWNSTVRGGEDRAIWGKEDYWATPLESLGKQAGDCEDFVIGKYFSLVHMGVTPEKLRFIYVRARIGGMSSRATIAHMVLGYYATPDSDPLVLDNLMGSIVPASQRRDLTPVFSFNAQGIYVSGAAATSTDRIGNWRDLLSRMSREGFVP